MEKEAIAIPYYLVIARRGQMRWLVEHHAGGPAVFVLRHHARAFIDDQPNAKDLHYEIVRLLAEVIFDSATTEGDESCPSS